MTYNAPMRPTFIVSLDEELAWGSFDHTPASAFGARYPDLRGVVRELLAAFDEHGMPATWALVGHLFLSSCARGPDGRAHPELVRPEYPWRPGDWLSDDPCGDRESHPLWYGDDVLEMIRAAKVRHEVASHSFSHIVYGDPGTSDAAVRSDLRACVEAAAAKGVTLKSFVFPRNREGHHAALRDAGFSAYRGVDPVWYGGLPRPLRRAAHLADQALALTPPVSVPVETLPGLWNVPGSMLLLHRGGVRRAIPVASRVAKGKAGLARAVREGKIFHLWFHPFNLAHDRGAMFAALRGILAEAARLRDRGALDVRTMGETAEAAAAAMSERR
jgi:peptidoglycan/xylan/chitin deacetylase (PgdA/CDA1 family)